MSKHLKSARSKLEKGDFSKMSPMELEALAKWSAGIEDKPRKSKALPHLIEVILDMTNPADREATRAALFNYLEDRVAVSIEKTWTAEDFKQVK